MIERHYLQQWGSSFTENFYGLKRERSVVARFVNSRALQAVPSQFEPFKKLRQRDVWLSIAGLCALPYAESKLNDLYEHLSGAASARFMATGSRRQYYPPEKDVITGSFLH